MDWFVVKGGIMDKTMYIKKTDMNVDVHQVFQTLIKIVSGTKDKEELTAFIKALAERELAAYKIETELTLKITEIAAKFYNQRIQEYRETLKKAKVFACFRKMEIEKEAVEYAKRDTKNFVEVLSGKEKVELLQGGREALQQATRELIKLLQSSKSNIDMAQLAGKLKYAIQ